jgi:hypothetical protein
MVVHRADEYGPTGLYLETIQLCQFEIPTPGEYRLELCCDDVSLGEVEFEAELAETVPFEYWLSSTSYETWVRDCHRRPEMLEMFV